MGGLVADGAGIPGHEARDRKIPAWEICHEFAGSLLSDLPLIDIVSVLQEDGYENIAGIYRKRSYHLSQCQ